MPFCSRPRHSTAVERRPVGYPPALGFFRLPRGVPQRLLSEAYQSSSQRSIPTTVKSGRGVCELTHAWQGKGMGAAWARHAMCESALNRQNYVYWSSGNPHIHLEKHVNLPGLTVWCGLSSRGLIGPFIFESTVTGALYLDMLQTSTLSAIRELYGDESFYLQQDGALPHYHRDVRMYLDETVPGRWIGRRSAVEFPPRSPDLTPLDFYLWGVPKG